MKRAPAGRVRRAAHRAITTLVKALAHASNKPADVGRRKVPPDNAGAAFLKILPAPTIPGAGSAYLLQLFQCGAPSKERWRERLDEETDRLPGSHNQSVAAKH